MSDVIPPAAFGTLAIYSLVPGHVVDVVGAGPGEIVAFDGADAPDDLETRCARLEACTGFDVELTYADGCASRTAAGKLESLGPRFAVLDGAQGHVAVPLPSVSRMQLLDLPLRVHVVDEHGAPAARTTLAMAYLRKGITWIPEYTVGVDETQRIADLELRATLVNEALDLIHCDVHFVVGVPSFAHHDFMAPIVVGTVIKSLGAAVMPAEYRGQIMSRAAIVTNSVAADQFASAGVSELPVAVEGDELQQFVSRLPNVEARAAADYTVHTVRDLTVRHGEKAIVALFRGRAPFAHFYRWSPPGRPVHELALANQTGSSWTTGPCLILEDGHPLGQGLLRYTPIGGECQLVVTTAVDLAHERTEEEQGRELKAHNPRRDVYLDLVTLRGTLRLRNLDEHAATVLIEVPVPGKPVSASGGGTLASDPANLVLGQRTGTIRWRIRLEPGESAELEYAYERFVPSA